MLIITAHNVSGGNGTKKDGTAETADYDVAARINDRIIWHGSVTGHVRALGAAALLRRIADRMEEEKP